jgi:hypothetical protein
MSWILRLCQFDHKTKWYFFAVGEDFKRFLAFLPEENLIEKKQAVGGFW